MGGVDIVRYVGSDPYGMSVELAAALAEARGGASEWAVLVSGESWTDAVAAGPLAASLDAPVLLVPPGGLQSSAARADLVEFLESTGARRVVIVGSPEVLPNHEPSVLFGLGMLPRNIERVHGDDPVGTSIAVAERIGAPAEFGELGRTVIIASDRSVADAVAVGPLAAAGPFPLLLTAPDALDPRITAYLAEHEVTHAVLVGGTAALAAAVQAAVEAADITVTRLTGRDRSDTARLAAELLEQHIANDRNCTDGPARLGIAPALHPAQALTAGPLLAQQCSPLRYIGPEGPTRSLRNDLFLAQARAGGAELHVFERASVLPDYALETTRPPVRIATWGLTRAETAAVLIVSDGQGQLRSYPETAVPLLWRPMLPRPAWGADGRLLAYRDPASGGLLILDTVSGELELVRYAGQVPEVLFYTGPSWSPDGSRLIFSGVIEDETTLSETSIRIIRPEFTAELFVYDAYSASVSRLTHDNYTDGFELWSPDSTEVFYSTWLWPGAIERISYGRTLSVVNVETRDSRHLSHRFLPWGLSRSPDGSRVLLAGFPDDGWPSYSSDIFVVGTDGSGIEQLTPSNCEGCVEPRYGNEAVRPHGAHSPSWSPGGDKAIYGMWVRTADGESSFQVHDFATGKGRILIPLGPDDLATRGLVVGWASNHELFFWFRNLRDNRDNSYEPPEFVSTVDVTTGSVRPQFELPWRSVSDGEPVQNYSEAVRQQFELPWRSVSDTLDRPVTISMSPDRQHFAVSYREAGLHVYSLPTQRWTAIAEPWSPSDYSSEGILGSCTYQWSDNGILGTCNELLNSGA